MGVDAVGFGIDALVYKVRRFLLMISYCRQSALGNHKFQQTIKWRKPLANAHEHHPLQDFQEIGHPRMVGLVFDTVERLAE